MRRLFAVAAAIGLESVGSPSDISLALRTLPNVQLYVTPPMRARVGGVEVGVTEAVLVRVQFDDPFYRPRANGAKADLVAAEHQTVCGRSVQAFGPVAGAFESSDFAGVFS